MGRSLLLAFRGYSHPLTSLVCPQRRKLEMMERFLGFQTGLISCRYMERETGTEYEHRKQTLVWTYSEGSELAQHVIGVYTKLHPFCIISDLE